MVREAKRIVGARSLQGYFDGNLAKIVGSWEAPSLSDTHAVTEGNAVVWKEGTVTLVDPRKTKTPARVLLAAAEGKEYYYLMLISEKGQGGAGDGVQARQILGSLRVR